MQIKTTIGYHLIPVRKAIIKNNNKHWQRCGEEETFVHCWQKCKLVQHMENSMEVLQKTRNKLPYDPAIQCCVYICVCVCEENKNINLKRYIQPTVNNSIT